MSLKLNKSNAVAFAVLLVLLAGCLAYVNTLPGEWVWDDASSVLLHKHVQDPYQLPRLFVEDQHAFGRGQGNFYRPLVSVTFMIDYQLAGGPAPEEGQSMSLAAVSPFVFHLSNMAWHIAAALCLLGLLFSLGAPVFVLLSVPLVFVLHPLHTEAVAYISGRADMMSATGVFAALWSVVLYQKRACQKRYLFYSAVFFTAALLSKESSLIYPVLLVPFMFLLVPQARAAQDDEETTRLAPFYPLLAAVAILILYIVLRSTVLSFSTAAASTVSPLSQRLYETIQSLGIYLKLLFAPFSLHMERTLVNATFVDALLGVLFLLALLGTLAVAFLKKLPHAALGALWFLLCWLPISGIFPLNAPLAEHWMYVPMAGFWWCLAELVASIVSSQRVWRAVWVVLCLFCIYLGTLTVQRNLDWSSNEGLFLTTLRQNPNSARVHHNLAVTYSDLLNNDLAAKRHYEIFLGLRNKERLADPERAGLIIDDEIEARLALGQCLMRLSLYDEALGIYIPMIALSEVDSLRPTAAMAALKAGQCLLALGEIAQSNMYFQEALTLEPLYGTDVEAIFGGDAIFNLY